VVGCGGGELEGGRLWWQRAEGCGRRELEEDGRELRPEEGEGEEGEGYRERERRWWRVSNRKTACFLYPPAAAQEEEKNFGFFLFFFVCTGRLR
jgi:hypothetical protein